ncbi:MAG: hypothetical protein Q8K65_04655 [Alphaproteobacteria bacterium]|nr:hypothetical protein [Alphaproteobacteria bacterium]
MMTRDEFTDLLDLYGADLSRWPQDRLKAALALTEKDTEARARFDSMLAMEEHMRAYTAPQSDLSALESRILSAVAALPAQQTAVVSEGGFLRWRPAFIFAPSGGLAVLAVIGFFIGMQPAIQPEKLMNAVYYQTEQILVDDSEFYDGRIF